MRAGNGRITMARKIVQCEGCGEERDLAGGGLCFRCYQRRRRADDSRYVDRHNPSIRKEHEPLSRGFQRMVGMFADLRVGKEDVLYIRRRLQPYFGPIADILSPPRESDEAQGVVVSERASELKTENSKPAAATDADTALFRPGIQPIATEGRAVTARRARKSHVKSV